MSKVKEALSGEPTGQSSAGMPPKNRDWLAPAALGASLLAALIAFTLGQRDGLLGVLPSLAEAACWLLLVVVAKGWVHVGTRRARKAHQAAGLAAVLGFCAALAAPWWPVALLPFVLGFHFMMLVAFSVREMSGRRWNAAAGTMVDSSLIGVGVMVVCAPLFVGSPAGVPLLLCLVVASAASPIIGPYRRGTGLGRRSHVTGLVLLLMGLADILVLRGGRDLLAEGASWLSSGGSAVLGCLGIGVLTLLIGRGVLTRPPARSRDIRSRREWVLYGIEVAFTALVAGLALLYVSRDKGVGLIAVSGVAAFLGLVMMREYLVRRMLSGLARGIEQQVMDQASSNRLAALGEFARSVAHDIRNSLAVFYSTIALLSREERPQDQRLEMLEMLQSEGERMAQVVSELTAYAGHGQLNLAPMNLADLLRLAGNAAQGRSTWPPQALVDWSLLPAGTAVAGDWPRLESAFSHVVLCAAQGGAKRVVVRESRDVRDDEELATVEIEGNGEEVDEALFSGGASSLTASRAEGGALGMAVARRTVREHGGVFQLSSNQHGGLTVLIELPVHGR